MAFLEETEMADIQEQSVEEIQEEIQKEEDGKQEVEQEETAWDRRKREYEERQNK